MQETIRGHVFVLGERADRVFVLLTPTDVQFSVDDSQARMEYDRMFQGIEQIKSTFKLK
ncbi:MULTISPECIES: hypothetical protein [Paenibacillus]|uniref:hypothetical protein n=1 Tax=Paenibacillus TaxID=44249 RepID=UPI0022B93E89|nr:hypothetical protein [Paenibacillus caseinilyticus]MCZ8521026.1 hypothetical protein [Paenibacillus caseinilyticus]